MLLGKPGGELAAGSIIRPKSGTLHVTERLKKHVLDELARFEGVLDELARFEGVLDFVDDIDLEWFIVVMGLLETVFSARFERVLVFNDGRVIIVSPRYARYHKYPIE